MSSAILRKSVTDLTRRKARAFFTVLTLALAVASVGLFAVPALMQQAMDREIATNRLADVTLTTKPVVVVRGAAAAHRAASERPRRRGDEPVLDAHVRRRAPPEGARHRRAATSRGQQVDVVATASGSRAGRRAPCCSDTQNARQGQVRRRQRARSSPPTAARDRCRSPARAAR